jgi:hypothetical protein
MQKEQKSSNELACIIADRLSHITGKSVAPPLPVSPQAVDSEGRNWDATEPAPSPEIRRVIDAVRDEYDLSP